MGEGQEGHGKGEREGESGGRSLNRNGLDGGWTGLFFLKPLSLSS